jgi:hypothetical protein
MQSTEYLKNFDTFCDNLDKAMGFSEFVSITNPIFTSEQIIEMRKDAMSVAYDKYGSVQENYIKNKIMRPVEDILIRVGCYERTHNLKYCIDIINFAMLEYWSKTKYIAAFRESDVLSAMIETDLLDWVCIGDSVTNWVDLYSESGDFGYLGIIALRAKYEIQSPMYMDSELQVVNEDTETAGFSYKDKIKYRKEQ